MSSRRVEFPRRAVRWLVPAALLAVAPKCLLCVAAYAGLGAALGRGSAEICGAAAGSPGSWVPSLAGIGIAIGILGAIAHVKHQHHKRRGPSALVPR